jgi:mannose-1-phosphate guanylyltransferase/mannose-6-phosphate isomerase
MAKFTPVILSGGVGSRLWPLSRASFPKQFCELLDESLLEKTLKRVAALGSPWVQTVPELGDLTARAFQNQGLSRDQMIFEPAGRNTAPAIALLCRVFELRGESDAIIGIFPADHLILKDDVFLRAVELAADEAARDTIVTLGLEPQYPATGFGYIEVDGSAGSSLKALGVKSFREKPDLATAQKFIAEKRFFWNAGIFIFKVSHMQECLRRLAPEIFTPLQAVTADLANLPQIYPRLPSISIDYAVMEKAHANLLCIPCDIGWNDLGSWDDVARFSEPPFSLDFLNKAKVVSQDSRGNFIYSVEKKIVGVVGLDDIIAIDTPDALLLARKGSTQDVRKVVDQLNALGETAAVEHSFEQRLWGRYTSLRDEPSYKSKLVSVDPGKEISYQYHTKRNEHWVFVGGAGEVTIDTLVKPVRAGDAVFIPALSRHGVRNTSASALEFIEVQTGTYFGEDDIIRLEAE